MVQKLKITMLRPYSGIQGCVSYHIQTGTQKRTTLIKERASAEMQTEMMYITALYTYNETPSSPDNIYVTHARITATCTKSWDEKYEININIKRIAKSRTSRGLPHQKIVSILVTRKQKPQFLYHIK